MVGWLVEFLEFTVLLNDNTWIIIPYFTTKYKTVMLLFSFLDRAGSISTLDSLDFARYSDDGNRETDERVAGE